LLFADQIGQQPQSVRAEAGISWIRLLTDLPTSLGEIYRGRQDLREYVRSLRTCNTEAVFSLKDPLPGLVELMLVPYLFVKRGY
jgi:predicted ATP-grasp superfamily ATP-dependent carboligase